MTVVALMPWMGANHLWLELTELVMFFAMLTSGLNLTFGYAGELAFSQPALYALGAYLGGYMALHGANNILFTVLASAVAAGLAGLVVGIPALRLGGWSMAMVSFFLILTVPDIVNLLQAQTGGTSGLAGIPLPQLFGATLTNSEYFVICVGVAGLVVLLTRNLIRSRHGRAFLVLRESPVLARSLGINVYRLKVEAYVLGGMSAGVAGALFAYLYGYVSPSTFGFDAAIALIAASVIGGSRSLYGCFIGAAIVQIGPFESTSFQQYSLVVYGLLLAVVGVLLPYGVPSLAAQAWRRLQNRTGLLADPVGSDVQAPTRRSLRASSVGKPANSAAVANHPPSATASEVTIAASDASLSARAGVRGGQPAGGSLTIRSGERGVSVVAVSKEFGGVKALEKVSLQAAPGRITALIGANGSGKTTLLNVIAGLYPPSGGDVLIDGQPVARRASDRALSAGVARTFQTPIVPDGLTTEEVVMTARYRMDYVGLVPAMLRSPRYRRVAAADMSRAREVLERVGLGAVVTTGASSLPLGSRRLLEVARALAAEPRVLLLDEPASGLSEADVERLGDVLRCFRDAGGVIILVEHNFGFVTQISDDIHVMELGRVLVSGAPAEIRNHPEVVRSYLGEEFRAAGPKSEAGEVPASPRGTAL